MKMPEGWAPPTPKDIIENAISVVRQFRHENWKSVAKLCESPIEEIFLAAVFASNIDRSEPVFIYGAPYSGHGDLFDGDHLWTQAPIGKYRADFLFVRITNGIGRRLVVECDGHEFHQKTKEQASHDKARDRYFVSQGFQVMRFTGSEIYRDPNACWAEVLNVLWGLPEAA